MKTAQKINPVENNHTLAETYTLQYKHIYIMVHGFSKILIDSPSRISEVPNSEPLIQVNKV